MLLREHSGDAVLAIGQPAHAWLSGQLARAWGNAAFGAVEPRDEVCLAADQHDVGMAMHDLAPRLDPATGLPHPFNAMPFPLHLELWEMAPRRLLTQSRYAALLVSMHGEALYRMRDLGRMAPEEAARVRAYLAGQQALQAELAAALGADPVALAAQPAPAVDVGLPLARAVPGLGAVLDAGDAHRRRARRARARAGERIARPLELGAVAVRRRR